MKIQILLAFVCVSLAPATYAKKEKKQNYTTIKRYNDSIFNSKKSDAKASCKRTIFNLLSAAEAELKDYSQKGYKYECKEVKFEIEAIIKRDGNFGSSSKLWTAVDYRSHINVNVYCAPRSLRAKQIYSLAIRCEENPTELCFKDSILDKIDELAETTFTYKYLKNHCK